MVGRVVKHVSPIFTVEITLICYYNRKNTIGNLCNVIIVGPFESSEGAATDVFLNVWSKLG